MKKIIYFICLTCFIMTYACGCSSGEGSVSSVMSLFVNINSDEVLKIDDTVCTLPEAMLVLMTEQNKYKDILGDDGWDTMLGDTTIKQYVMDDVKNRLSIIYALCAMAEDIDVELTTEETSYAGQMAEEYYQTLNEYEIEYTGITKKDAINLVEYCILAQKVYDTVAQENMTVEISDEQARVINIQYIYETDKDKIDNIYKKAQDENEDFLLLAEEYSQDETNSINLKRGDGLTVLEETAFSLDTGEISDILESDSGYYIIKCVDSYLEAETNANKTELVSEAKAECVSQIYEEFLDSASSVFNDSAWEKIEFSDNENVTSTAFSELFADIFKEAGEE